MPPRNSQLSLLGHGFGLPHTDENFYNSDMGNCLDYTHSPANNMHPGDVNFEKLESLYLSNDASTNGEENDGRRTSTQQQRKREGYVEEEGLYEKEDNKGRYVRRVVQRHYIYRS